MDYRDYNDYELLNYVAEGNEDANNIVYEKYKPLIRSISLKFISNCENTGLELVDLEQEGMIGLTQAINSFSDQKDASFYTYAKTCIRRSIITAVVTAKRKKHQILNESLSFDNDDISCEKILKDNQMNPENIIVGLDMEDNLINKIKNKLTDLEDQVFQLMISGFGYKEIAELLDKDKKSIDNTIQRVKSKIRDIINTKKAD